MSGNNTPKAYQEVGTAFLAANPRALMGDDAGLGKSMQMIRAANAIGARRVLITCPAIGRVSWKLQLAEWDTSRRPVYIHPDRTAPFPMCGPAAVVVSIDYLSAPARLKTLLALLALAEPFDVGIVDEAHFLKNPKAKRTKAVYGPRLDLRGGVLDGVRYIWPASATLTPNNASEIYPHLAAVLPDVLRDLFNGRHPTLFEFTQRFCNTTLSPFGLRITGNNRNAIPDLRAAIRPHLILRRKADVLSELPPIITTLFPIDVDEIDEIDEIAANCGAGADDDDEFLAALAIVMDDPSYAAARRARGLLKAKALIPWIDDFLSSNPGAKLAVFGHHRDVLETITTACAKWGAVLLNGATPQAEREKIVFAYQNDIACRLFVGQTRSAGTSITLTAGDTALLVEPDPSPVANYQAISRLHRLGQTGTVTAHFCFAANNYAEQRLATILRRRAEDNEQLFGAKPAGYAPAAGAPAPAPHQGQLTERPDRHVHDHH